MTMALPGPFRPGQWLTAGQLNDATQKTIVSVDVNYNGNISGTINTVETTIDRLTLGPMDQVAGALYKVHTRLIMQVDNDDSEFFIIMRKNTPLTGDIVASWNVWRPPWANFAFLFTGWADFPAVVDEAGVIYYFSMVRSATGTGNGIIWGHHPNVPLSVTPTGVKIERTGYASEYSVVTL